MGMRRAPGRGGLGGVVVGGDGDGVGIVESVQIQVLRVRRSVRGRKRQTWWEM